MQGVDGLTLVASSLTRINGWALTYAMKVSTGQWLLLIVNERTGEVFEQGPAVR